MPNPNNYIDFKVLIDLTGNSFIIKLTDVGNNPLADKHSLKGLFSIRQPDGISIGNTNYNNPDISWGNGSLNEFIYSPRLSCEGQIQNGIWEISYKSKTDNTAEEVITKRFYLNYKEPHISIDSDFNVFEPDLSFKDITNYSIPGFIQSVNRNWTVIAKEASFTINGNGEKIMVLNGSHFYDSLYEAILTSTITYQNEKCSWLSIKTIIIGTKYEDAFSPPSCGTLFSQLQNFSNTGDCGCSQKKVAAGLLNTIDSALKDKSYEGLYPNIVDFEKIVTGQQYQPGHTGDIIEPFKYDCGCSSDKQDTCQGIKAFFNSQPVGYTVLFFDGSMPSINANKITSWEWDFGDGDTSSDQSPAHNYGTFGEYTVKLRIIDDKGCSSSFYKNISVNNQCTGINADFDISINKMEVSLTDSSEKSDKGADIISWEWTFGDGSSTTQYNPSHVYSKGGSFSISLEITDANGCVSKTTKPVNITDSCNGILADFEIEKLGKQVTLTDKSNPSDNGSIIVSYLWDFGDGNTSTDENPVHAYLNWGRYDVKLTIIDDNGCSSVTTKNIYLIKPNEIFYFGTGGIPQNETEVKSYNQTESLAFSLIYPSPIQDGFFAYPDDRKDLSSSDVTQMGMFNVGNVFDKSAITIDGIPYKIYTYSWPVANQDNVTFEVTIPDKI